MGHTVELDVRPHLKKKLEPFQLIMDTVKKLERDDLFVLHATFKPSPLLGLMRTKGFRNKVEKIAPDHWTVTFAHKSNLHLLDVTEVEEETDHSVQNRTAPSNAIIRLDNRGLGPPQPMIRTLAQLDAALPGDQVVIHNDRVPMFLIEELNTLGYPFEVDQQDDGSAIVTITKK